jgi:hypothetical protein
MRRDRRIAKVAMARKLAVSLGRCVRDSIINRLCSSVRTRESLDTHGVKFTAHLSGVIFAKSLVEHRNATPNLSSSFWKDPIRPDEMARVSVGNTFQVILVFRLGFPECISRNHFGHSLPGPQP